MNVLHHPTASVLCLGTNQGSPDVLQQAALLLMPHLPDLCLSTPVETIPIQWPWPGRFINRVAVTHTGLSEEALTALCKHVEQQLGRLPHHKQQGIVRIDIDLLFCRGKVIKAADLQRPYVVGALKELGW